MTYDAVVSGLLSLLDLFLSGVYRVTSNKCFMTLEWLYHAVWEEKKPQNYEKYCKILNALPTKL